MHAALRAVRRDEKDAYAHFALAMTHVFSGELEQAIRAAEKAAEISPSFALAHVGLGMARLYTGQAQAAIEPLERGLRLNPFDPQNSHWFPCIGARAVFLGPARSGAGSALRAVKARPGWPLTLETAAVCYAALGQMQEAHECIDQMRRLPAPKGDPTAIMRATQSRMGQGHRLLSCARVNS